MCPLFATIESFHSLQRLGLMLYFVVPMCTYLWLLASFFHPVCHQFIASFLLSFQFIFFNLGHFSNWVKVKVTLIDWN